MTNNTSNLDVMKIIQSLALKLGDKIEQNNITEPKIIGIHTGGLWVAKQLQQQLKISQQLGSLNIAFYRDDFTRIGLHPQVTPSSLPFTIDNQNIILVDDVLYTGRTIRAALNEIFDYGRPSSVLLVTLIDRPGRELPIQADISGMFIELTPQQHIKLTGPKPLCLEVTETNEAK